MAENSKSGVEHKRVLPSGKLASATQIGCGCDPAEPDLLMERTQHVSRDVIRRRFEESQEPHEPVRVVPRDSHLANESRRRLADGDLISEVPCERAHEMDDDPGEFVRDRPDLKERAERRCKQPLGPWRG